MKHTWLISLLLAITWLAIYLVMLERQAAAPHPHNVIWPANLLLITSYTPLPIILSPSTVAGSAYYVAINGNDNNPGTLSQPWRTIQKAANILKPGDTVYVRRGVYNESVTVNVSGSAKGGYITFQNYPGEIPTLDGTGLTVPPGDTGLFLIVNRSYLIIQGFEIRNYKTTIPSRVPIGIHVRGVVQHLYIRNNRIHHIETNAPVDADLLGADAHGIAVYGTSAPASINNVVIDGNELHNLKLGSSEALVLNGNVETFTITHNIIRDSDNIGLDFIGYEGTAPNPIYDRARDGLVSGNTIFNIDSLTNPAYGGWRGAGGIYVDGGTNIVVERNRVYSANIGIEIASEHQGRATSFITVRNNLIFNNHIAGLAMGGYDTMRGSTENCIIVNNTLFNNDTQEDGNGEILIQFDTRNNVIKNNIIHAHNMQSLLMSNAHTQNTGNVVDYNLYFAPAGMNDSEWGWKDVMYQGFAAYQAGSDNDTHSIFADPQFVNPANFDLHLQATSPAINAGENLSSIGAGDIDSEARIQGGTVDLGADERQ